MSNQSLLVTQEAQAGMDLDLFLKIVPGVRVGDRIIRLDLIESVDYGFPATEETANPEEITSDTEPMLILTMQSGELHYFDSEQERELEIRVIAFIKKQEEQMTQFKALQIENAQLQQALAQSMAGNGPKIVNPFGRGRG